MDEMGTWYEVIRALQPERYPMSILWERDVIVVSSPRSGRSVWLNRQTLRGRTPTSVVRALILQLAPLREVGPQRVAS